MFYRYHSKIETSPLSPWLIIITYIAKIRLSLVALVLSSVLHAESCHARVILLKYCLLILFAVVHRLIFFVFVSFRLITAICQHCAAH